MSTYCTPRTFGVFVAAITEGVGLGIRIGGGFVGGQLGRGVLGEGEEMPRVKETSKFESSPWSFNKPSCFRS